MSTSPANRPPQAKDASVAPVGRVSRVLGALVLLGAIVGVPACGDDGREPEPGGLPPVSFEAPVFDVLSAFAAGQVVVEASHPDYPLALWAPHFVKEAELASDEDRRVLRAHAESAFTVTTPVLGRGARLVVRTMVYSDARNDPESADPVPLEFRIAVDGETRASLSSAYVREPRENVYDQLMRELTVDLGAYVGRSVSLRFATTRERPIPPGVVAPEPLWWSATVLQEKQVARQRSSVDAPNLLVLCVDTLAARRTSLDGYARDTTPRLAALAARGTLFAAATSASSWTLPSTASLLTGLPPNTHGVLGDGRDWLMDALATWPERLREAGIPGAAFAGNPLVSPSTNFAQGFSHFESEPGTGQGDADADALHARFLAWLDGQPRDGRWFSYVHTMDPHAPYGPPHGRERWTHGYVERRSFAGHLPGMLQKDEIDPLTADEQDHVGDLYDAEVSYVDETLGALLDALSERGELERTVIIFTADHGEELFEHGRLGHGYALSDVMLHVPLVIAGPGVPAGRRVAAPVSTAALYNTLLRLAGLDPVEGAARPLLPLVDAGARAEPVYSLTRTSLFGPRAMLVSVRDGAGRKVVLEVDEDSGEERARTLYDLFSDAEEQHPLDADSLGAEDAAAYERLVEGAKTWYLVTKAARPAGEQGGSDVEDALRELGYVGGREDPPDADAKAGADAGADVESAADPKAHGASPRDEQDDGR